MKNYFNLFGSAVKFILKIVFAFFSSNAPHNDALRAGQERSRIIGTGFSNLV